MPPHRALQVDEILRIIFSNINPISGSNGESPRTIDANRSTLLNAALACTAFRDPALTALWEELDSVETALRVLPSFVTVETPAIADPVVVMGGSLHRQLSKDISYRLDRDPTAEEWARFHCYARKVRKIFFWSGPAQFNARQDVLNRLRFLYGQPLFGGLQRLYYVASASTDRTLLSFVPPTLRYLWLSVYAGHSPAGGTGLSEDEVRTMQLLHNVIVGAPNLAVLRLPRMIRPITLAGITGRTNFRCAELKPNPCTSLLVEYLATMPALADLKLDICGYADGYVGTRGFHQLQTLRLSGRWPPIQAFLPFVLSVHLTDLQIEITTDVHALNAHCASIASDVVRFFPGLRNISLVLRVTSVFGPDAMQDVGQQAVPIASGRRLMLEHLGDGPLQGLCGPLTGLNALERFDLAFSPCACFTKETMLDLGVNWPSLKSFSLLFDAMCSAHDFNTARREGEDILEGTCESWDHSFLVEFISRFPMMQEVTLPNINFKRIGTLSTTTPVFPTVRSIQLGNQRNALVSDENLVAAFLDNHFPSLEARRMLEAAETTVEKGLVRVHSYSMPGVPPAWQKWHLVLASLINLHTREDISQDPTDGQA